MKERAVENFYFQLSTKYWCVRSPDDDVVAVGALGVVALLDNTVAV